MGEAQRAVADSPKVNENGNERIESQQYLKTPKRRHSLG